MRGHIADPGPSHREVGSCASGARRRRPAPSGHAARGRKACAKTRARPAASPRLSARTGHRRVRRHAAARRGDRRRAGRRRPGAADRRRGRPRGLPDRRRRLRRGPPAPSVDRQALERAAGDLEGARATPTRPPSRPSSRASTRRSPRRSRRSGRSSSATSTARRSGCATAPTPRRSGARSRACEAAGVADDDARLRKLRELDDPDRHFLLFDPAGDGRAAEVFGDLTSARHVAVVVPGMNNDLNNFTGGDAERVQHQASLFDPDQVATIQWLGYDTPEGATALCAGRRRAGRRGAAAVRGGDPRAAQRAAALDGGRPLLRLARDRHGGVRARAAGRRDGADRLARGRRRARERPRRRQRLGRARPVGRRSATPAGTVPTRTTARSAPRASTPATSPGTPATSTRAPSRSATSA